MDYLDCIEIRYVDGLKLSKPLKNCKFAEGTGFFGRIEASEGCAELVAPTASSKTDSAINTFKCRWH